MRKWIIGAGILALLSVVLLSERVRAGITCTLPFTLQNNTTADATQVMANYNALVTCFTSAAAAGVNSDITSLTALSTPLPVASGGSSVYIGGTSTGSANAQVVASATPISFTLTSGKRITFVAGFSNTAATTLNVNAQGATNVYRRTQLGVSALVGGEIVAGQLIEAVFDGTQFQLLGQVMVGSGADWFTTTAPAGYLFRDGTSYLRADYPDLFTVIGTTYGAADGTHFNVPDERGRVSVMKDGASRITGVCAAANTLGTACGNTAGTVTVAQANIPSYNLSLASLTFTVTTQMRVNKADLGAGAINYAVDALNSLGTTTTSSSIAVGGTLPSGGSGTALTTLDGSLVVNKIIKY